MPYQLGDRIKVKLDYLRVIWAFVRYQHRRIGKLNVAGPDEFYEQTRKAFEFLKEKSPLAFERVNQYINTILFYKRSFTLSTLARPLCMISGKIAYHSIIYYASVLAHEA